MLTNQKLYNVKKTELQRTIALENIKALTKSLDPKRATSFIVHVKSEYDYQFDSEQRDDIFNQIKYYFWNIKKYNLPIYAVREGIEEFATKKTDIQKDKEVQPMENCRQKKEDIYPESASAIGSSVSFTTEGSTDVNQAEIDAVNTDFKKQRANTIFQRGLKVDEEPASLDTFQVVKVIGKGSFGKVFLV